MRKIVIRRRDVHPDSHNREQGSFRYSLHERHDTRLLDAAMSDLLRYVKKRYDWTTKLRLLDGLLDGLLCANRRLDIERRNKHERVTVNYPNGIRNVNRLQT